MRSADRRAEHPISCPNGTLAEQAAHLAVRLGDAGRRSASRARGRPRVARAARRDGTSAATTASTSAGRAGRDRHRTAHRRPRAAVAAAAGAVHQRGHLVGERALGERAARARRRARRAARRSRRAVAATASSGTYRPSRRRSAPRTAGTGTARCAAGSSHTAPPTDLPNLVPSLFSHQRMGHRERLAAEPAADQLDPGDDVAPLIAGAGLQLDTVAPRTGDGSRWPAAACS